MLRTVLLLVAWIVPLLYAMIPAFWFMVHPFAARWRRVRRPYLYLVPLWVLTMLAGAALTWPYHRIQLYDSWATRVVGAAVVIAAMAVYRAVGREHLKPAQLLGRSEVEENQEQRLVTTGMHGRVRHPIYLAALLMVVGWTVGSGLLADYLLLGFAAIAFTVMIRLEERELTERFGDAYREYKQRVPAIIPMKLR